MELACRPAWWSPAKKTHAYGNRNLAAEEHLVADQPKPGADLIVQNREERFTTKHARVTRRIKLAGAINMEETLPDGDADGELNFDRFLMAKQLSAARLGGAIRLGDVIQQIIVRDNLERPVSPPTRMPAPLTPQRAGPSGLNVNLPPFCRRLHSFNENELERPVWPPRRPHMEFNVGNYEQEEDIEPEPPKRRNKLRPHANPFIDAEAGVNGDASGDEEGDKNKDYN